METVELIATGYEWICPFCYDDGNPDYLQLEIEVTNTVVCESCGQEFKVGDVYHAHEGGNYG